MRRSWRKACLAFLAGGLLVVGINVRVKSVGQAQIPARDGLVPAEAALVLGAYVYENGGVCPVLQDRLDTALELYRQGLVPKLLLSGDHGQHNYDEVNAMRKYLEAKGVPPEDLFLDHAGFDTYDSLYRARDVFGARRLIVVTQQFHLTRALYIGRGLGLEVQGVPSDRRTLFDQSYYEQREWGARVKAFYDVNSQRSPLLLGPAIDLQGDGRVTHDARQT